LTDTYLLQPDLALAALTSLAAIIVLAVLPLAICSAPPKCLNDTVGTSYSACSDCAHCTAILHVGFSALINTISTAIAALTFQYAILHSHHFLCWHGLNAHHLHLIKAHMCVISCTATLTARTALGLLFLAPAQQLLTPLLQHLWHFLPTCTYCTDLLTPLMALTSLPVVTHLAPLTLPTVLTYVTQPVQRVWSCCTSLTTYGTWPFLHLQWFLLNCTYITDLHHLQLLKPLLPFTALHHLPLFQRLLPGLDRVQ
jgi:hypothetical protein